MLVQVQALQDWATDIFGRVGLRDDDAALVSQTLVEADLRGVHSHGMLRVPRYVAGLRAGAIAARPEIRTVVDNGWAVVLDGGGGMGQIAAQAGMRRALERAADGGHAAVSVRGSTHCGAMAYYAMQAIPARAIGIATTNAGINMMPTGGRTNLVGNNPVAYAIPTGRDVPFVLDMATSVVAGGKLDVARIRGEKIPFGWAVDREGKPTDDPAAARQGALVPLGGPKGYGLAVVLDVLCGVLSGGRFGSGLGAAGSCHYFEVLRVEAFTPYEAFVARMGELIDQLHGCPPVEGSGGVLVPGEIEHRLREQRVREGIPLDASLAEELATLAASLGAPALATR